MKKQILLLLSVTFLSFFLVISVVAQEKKKIVKKDKTEQVKKDIPAKCKGCASLDKCKDGEKDHSKATVKSKKKVSDKKKKK